MRKFITIALAGAALSAAAAPAFAAERWSDAEYLKASRCLGLAESANLGAVDATALAAEVKDQGRGRDPLLRDRSDVQRDDARRAGKTRSDVLRAKLLAERDGVCKAYLQVTVASGGASS